MSQNAKPVEVVQDTQVAIDAILARCGNKIIAAAPLALGKPNVLLNALYDVVASDQSRSMHLFTALSLARPIPKPGLEATFLEPFLQRQFGLDYPDLKYVLARRKNQLPANIFVHEFYLQSGAWLQNDRAQREYSSINYTHVARDMAARKPNLIIQMVARRGDCLSLSCNPDVTLDLLDRIQADGLPRPFVVAVVHRDLPFLGNDAQQTFGFADLILDDPMPHHQLFAIPHEPVSLAEHAIGLHAASLVKDGGTLQIGIGALSDAIVHALIWRQSNQKEFANAIQALVDTHADAKDLSPLSLARESSGFELGLYGASEMVMDGFMHLRRSGILHRRVFDDLKLQKLLNTNAISEIADESTLDRLLEAGGD